MKSSVHLLYGIIIGILLVACTGSLKDDKAEFEVEKIFPCANFVGECERLKNVMGYTIIDWEIAPDGMHYFHVGK